MISSTKKPLLPYAATAYKIPNLLLNSESAKNPAQRGRYDLHQTVLFSNEPSSDFSNQFYKITYVEQLKDAHIKNYEFNTKHTIPADYFDNRLSCLAQLEIVGADEIDLFQGGTDKVMQFYNDKYKGSTVTIFKNASSIGVAALTKPKPKGEVRKVVLYNLNSQARTNNAILIIKGLQSLQSLKKTQKIVIRGSIAEVLQAKSRLLAQNIQRQLVHPLIEKISSNDAWQHMGEIINQAVD